MDKRVMFAVAGSGKTTLLVNRLSLEKRALIVTYTDNNYRHLRDSIIKRFGHVPKNINLAVAGAECNTVIELKPEHHAA